MLLFTSISFDENERDLHYNTIACQLDGGNLMYPAKILSCSKRSKLCSNHKHNDLVCQTSQSYQPARSSGWQVFERALTHGTARQRVQKETSIAFRQQPPVEHG